MYLKALKTQKVVGIYTYNIYTGTTGLVYSRGLRTRNRTNWIAGDMTDMSAREQSVAPKTVAGNMSMAPTLFFDSTWVIIIWQAKKRHENNTGVGNKI